MPGSILWITGLSAAGKTTIAEEFIRKTSHHAVPTILLDGDTIRRLFDDDLGYDERSRIKHILRIQKLAGFLTLNDINVVVAALYSNPEILLENRRTFTKYFEVYLKADVRNLLLRQNNFLYTRAVNGEIDNVVGIDVPWFEPQHADLVIDTNVLSPPAEIVEQIINSWRLALEKE